MASIGYNLYSQLNEYLRILHDQEIVSDQMKYFKNHGNEDQIEASKAKLDIFETARQENILKYRDSIKKVRQMCDTQYKAENMKETIASLFNKVYNQNGKFDEFFDGFEIKFAQFEKDFKKFKNMENIDEMSKDMIKLNLLYMDYLNYHSYEIVLDSCEKIAEVMNESFDEEGRKKDSYLISNDPNILTINEDEIMQILDYISKKDAEFDKMKIQNHDDMKKSKNEQSEEYKTQMTIMNNNTSYLIKLENMVMTLFNRINSQQREHKTLKEKMMWNITDLASNIYYPKKKSSKDWTYITKDEIEYIKYLVKSIDENTNDFSYFFENFDKKIEDAIIFPEFGF